MCYINKIAATRREELFQQPIPPLCWSLGSRNNQTSLKYATILLPPVTLPCTCFHPEKMSVELRGWKNIHSDVPQLELVILEKNVINITRNVTHWIITKPTFHFSISILISHRDLFIILWENESCSKLTIVITSWLSTKKKRKEKKREKHILSAKNKTRLAYFMSCSFTITGRSWASATASRRSADSRSRNLLASKESTSCLAKKVARFVARLFFWSPLRSLKSCQIWWHSC